MWSLQTKNSESYTRFLTTRKSADWLQTDFAMRTRGDAELGQDLPCHTTDLEVAQMRTVLLFRLPRELARQELHR